MSEELKPCFCGARAILTVHQGNYREISTVCGHILDFDEANAGSEHIEAIWNTRADDPELAALREENARLKAEQVNPRPFCEAWLNIKRVLAWDVERKEWHFVTPVRFHPYCVGDDGVVPEGQVSYFIELPPPPTEETKL